MQNTDTDGSIIIDPLTLSVREAAKRLGIGKNTAYDSIRRGELPSLRFGNRIVVPKAALDELLKEASNKEDRRSRVA